MPYQRNLPDRVRDLLHASGLEHLTQPLQLKASGGRLKGYASTFGLPPDSYGDIIDRGAFSEWLREWRTKGKPLPLLDSHSMTSVRSIVGKLVEAKEDDYGLWTAFELLDGPDGEEVRRRVAAGLLNGLSIGYHVKDTRQPTESEREAGVRRVLTSVHLAEISVVIAPANDLARLVASARRRHPLWQDPAPDLPLLERLELIQRRRADMAVSRALAPTRGER